MDKEPVQISISGIKCDSCDYRNAEVPVEDYPKWVNKPCPNCGANLLTKEDYVATMHLMNIIDLFNEVMSPLTESIPEVPEEKKLRYSVEFDGTGNVSFIEKKVEEDAKE